MSERRANYDVLPQEIIERAVSQIVTLGLNELFDGEPINRTRAGFILADVAARAGREIERIMRERADFE